MLNSKQTANRLYGNIIGLCLSTMTLFGLVATAHADSTRLFNPSNGHAYQRFDTLKSWPSAKAACIATGGYLATVTSQAENDWIVKNQLHKGGSWIGGTDEAVEGTWKWLKGDAWSYTNWMTGMPDNYAGIEDYLQIFTADGKWNDNNANANMPYLCEWDLPANKVSPPIGAKNLGFTGTVKVTCQNTTSGQTVQFNKKSNQNIDCKTAGLTTKSGDTVSVNIEGNSSAFVSHKYQLKTDCGSWLKCKSYAEGQGGHLATISTADEQLFVSYQFRGANNFWIGLTDNIKEGSFQWVNAEPLTYTKWATGQPDNAGGSENCVSINSTGYWSDTNCSNSLPALIEFE